MSDAVQATTDRILACVGDLLGISEIEGHLPSRAILIFETLDEDGDASIEYVATKGMAVSDVIGMADVIREVALADMLAPDDE